MTLPGFPDPSKRRTGRTGARRDDDTEEQQDDGYQQPPPEDPRRSGPRYDDGYDSGAVPTERFQRPAPDRTQRISRHQPPPGQPRDRQDPPSRPPHHGSPTGGPPQQGSTTGRPSDYSADAQHQPGMPPRVTVTRVAAQRAREVSKTTVRLIGQASRADGAERSGLTKVLWLNVVQTGADAMIAVALANTIFFSAATSEQRSNVALYLLITMAPFAFVAPIIGPLLDRLQRGRRWALAGTMATRGVLAWIMAANFHNAGLYAAVFGFLVVSKAFNVLKGAVVPRVLPEEMTLVSANARLTIFGLGGGAVLGGFGILLVNLFDSAWTLRVSVIVFIVAAILAVKLPTHVDSAAGEVPTVMRSETTEGERRQGKGSLGSNVVTALRGASALRGLSGFLTLFLAFLIQHDFSGVKAATALGALAVAAGGGSFLGTAAGARLKLGKPDVIVVFCVAAPIAMCAITAIAYSIEFAVIAALVAGTSNSLAKLSLDAIIQREVEDAMRASAFGRSETLLQLAWVIGGGLSIALPMNGQIGFAVAALLLSLALLFTLFGGPSFLRRTRNVPNPRLAQRVARRNAAPPSTGEPPPPTGWQPSAPYPPQHHPTKQQPAQQQPARRQTPRPPSASAPTRRLGRRPR